MTAGVESSSQLHTTSLGVEYLSAALGWLHRLLQWQIALTRHTYGSVADDAYRGLYIPDAEIEQLQSFHPPLPAEFSEQRTRIFQEWQELEAQALTLHQTQSPIPLLQLA